VSNLKSVSLTVLELFAFNAHFKLVRFTVPLRTYRQTDRQTDRQKNHIERTRYLRHSHSLGGDKKILHKLTINKYNLF